MVFFLRSQLPNTDSRLQRYLLAVQECKKPYRIIGWDREGMASDEMPGEYILYSKYAKIGDGAKNIVNLIWWNLFLIRTLWKYRRSITTIHAIDFDTIISGFIICKFFGKKLIVDIYDKYSDTRNVSGVVKRIIDKIELFVCKKANVLILPDSCRLEQLGLPSSYPAVILENVPIVPGFNKNSAVLSDQPLVFSYVGILEEKNRGLEHLLNVISVNPQAMLLVAGDGPLKKSVADFAQRNKNIIFYGAVNQKDALEIMQRSHIIVGMYYKTVKNHLYASPNKYYEHLYLGKALLTTTGTPPGSKVLLNNTGFVIGETENDIQDLISNFSVEDFRIKCNNATLVWEKSYKDYRIFFQETYCNLLN